MRRTAVFLSLALASLAAVGGQGARSEPTPLAASALAARASLSIFSAQSPSAGLAPEAYGLGGGSRGRVPSGRYFDQSFPAAQDNDANNWLIFGEFLAGIAGQLIVGNAGMMVNEPVGLVGYAVGGTVGIFWAGTAGGDYGPFRRTLLGCSLGALAGWWLGPLTRGISFLLLPPVCGLYGYNGVKKMDAFLDDVLGK